MTDGSEPILEGDNLDRLQQLANTLSEVVRQLAAVADAGRKTRRLTVGLAVSFALDMILTVVVTLLTLSALNQGSAQRASQLAACAVSNQTRIAEQSLWAYVFQVSAPPKTAAQLATERKFLEHVDTIFAPVNCAAVYK